MAADALRGPWLLLLTAIFLWSMLVAVFIGLVGLYRSAEARMRRLL